MLPFIQQRRFAAVAAALCGNDATPAMAPAASGRDRPLFLVAEVLPPAPEC